MINLAQLRREPEMVKAALARRGVSVVTMDGILALDVDHRALLQENERLRAEIKELSRQVGDARRNKDSDTAEALSQTSRQLGEKERMANDAVERVATELHDKLLMIPNVPDSRVPDGLDEDDNVELCRWWVDMDKGAPFPTYADHQRVPHWEIGTELGILDMESGAKLAGSPRPLARAAST